ncbi:U32 family peptidase [Adlercreutzia sp. ZJ473]|uniref:U32 family peptidase n=1 Tax=Adlercreutzia sp. ZJ473 TaxID=2722822 RepID=UPI0020A6CB73|nr:U32 family peptidase [Adlercreutzia sp. ZJ473]
MELLAPAGGMEQLRAAVRFGADAVYLAADRFGMRARAANFALADIPEAVAFAHAAGCKVHVTCNVLMGPDDIDALPAYLRALDAAGVDALIIGDLGAFALAREHAPHVDLHVSTQASVANAAAARVWHSLGAKRVVCAREMSLGDIARLRQDAPPDLEIEAFAHGAMCMAVSGRCLISSYLTGRSGNRGHCTQPCRWSYTLEEEKRPGEHFPIEEDGRGTFIMNAKDLNMIEHLDALARAGVDSIKIEGRNKKAFYVATVVGAYRRALDGAPADEVVPELYAVSHRPYGTGFYFGEAEQACAYDGYEQEAMHVADVTGCEGVVAAVAAVARETAPAAVAAAAREGTAPFRLLARCRNRFAEGDELEVLSPHAPVRTVRVRSLTWLPDPTEDDPAPAPVPVPVANRSCNAYRFEAEGLEAPVPQGSFLRVRAFRRSARHGQPERA